MGRWKKHKYLQKVQANAAPKSASSSDEVPQQATTTPTDHADWVVDPNTNNNSNHHRHNNGDNDSATTTSTTAPSSSSSTPWTWKQRCQVSAYLRAYKQGCECVYAGMEPEYNSNNLLLMMIGQVSFPALTKQVFQQPWLALPIGLSNQNRKMIHECCVETFLFHKTTGERRSKTNPKTMFISPYFNVFLDGGNTDEIITTTSTTSDGQMTDQIVPQSYRPPIYQFRPWYCLKHKPWWLDGPDEIDEEEEFNEEEEKLNEQTTATSDQDRCATPVVSNTAYVSLRRSRNGKPFTSFDAQGKSLVDALIDHPEHCLRNDVDVLDFTYWDAKDLSDMEPPSADATTTTATGGGSWTLVDTPAKLRACSNALKGCRELGFDLEALNRSKYSQLTCLLQLNSNYGHDYVIDVLAPGVWDCVGPAFAPLFADPRIVKVGHSIGGLDARSLHRDFGIFVINVFDTYEAAQVLGLESHGLASVCDYYNLRAADHYKDLKQHYQMTDWRVRPLTKEMVEYGRYDVHYLLRLRWLMIRDLTRAELYDRTRKERNDEDHRVAATMAHALAQFRDDEEDGDSSSCDDPPDRNVDPIVLPVDHDDDGLDDLEDLGMERVLSLEHPKASAGLLRMQPRLMQVISRSQERCRDLWSGLTEPYLTHPMYMNILRQARHGLLKWTPNHFSLYEKLIEWRNLTAQELEILPGFVAPLEFLIGVAFQRPVSVPALRRVSLQFPELLEDDKACRQHLLDVVRQFVVAAHDEEEMIITPDHETNDEYLLEYGGTPDPVVCDKIRAKRRNRQIARRYAPIGINVNWRIVTALAVFTAVAAVSMAGRRWRRR